MTLTADPIVFVCPGCSRSLQAVGPGPLRCPQCSWKGEAYGFCAKALRVDQAELALPEDATCIHHPSKKAVAACAGTGDYVCALCAVELNGQTYSTAYLDNAGKELAGKAFERTIPRPDSRIIVYFLLCLVPYINAIVLVGACVWVPHSIFLYRKLLRVRREYPLMHRVVGNFRLTIIVILLVLTSLLWIAMVVGLVYLILQRP